MGCTDGGPVYESWEDRRKRHLIEWQCSEAELDFVNSLSGTYINEKNLINNLRKIIKEQIAGGSDDV